MQQQANLQAAAAVAQGQPYGYPPQGQQVMARFQFQQQPTAAYTPNTAAAVTQHQPPAATEGGVAIPGMIL